MTSPKSKSKNTNGMKIAIMAASLAITLGGWGAFATSQAQNVSAVAAAPVTSASSVSSQSSTSLRQVNPPAGQSQIITRTRSSR